MRIDGEWLLCDDGIPRPVIRGEILASDGTWQRAEYLVDTGGDRTVFSEPVLASLRLQPILTQARLGGVGGVVNSVVVETRLGSLARSLAKSCCGDSTQPSPSCKYST